MGEDPSQVGTPVEELRRDIAQTRVELGDTAAALAAKTDIKARAKEKVERVKSSGTTAGSLATQARTKAKENPTATAAGAAFFGGYLLGRLRSR